MARACPVCGPLLAEAEIGKRWLEKLVEVEPPAMLMHNILAATVGIDTARMRGDGRRPGSSLMVRAHDGMGPRSGEPDRSASPGSHVLPCHSAWHFSRCRFHSAWLE